VPARRQEPYHYFSLPFGLSESVLDRLFRLV